jgi:hypothetical protein
MITEIATNATPLAERADKLAESINRVDEPLAKIIEETDKIKEGLNESEDLWMIAAVAVRQLEKASDRQTAERLRDEIEKTFDQLVAIYGAAQESGELAKEVMVQANVTHQKALEEISRQKAEKARQEALQRQAEAEKLQAQQKAEELKKLRPTFVQKEFDELEKYRGASASLILRRKFSEAKRSFAAVRSKITLDEAVTLFKNVEETYTEIAKLQEWLIKMINSATCKNGWLMGESGQDITKASEEDGLTIELGSLGKSVIQWEAVPVNQWLRIVNYYVDPTKLSDSQRATIFKQTALFCYENGVFKTAETYANEAVKADPGLLPDLNRLMPGIVSAK